MIFFSPQRGRKSLFKHMGMEMPKFNPSNPEYKKVDDLPKEEQEKFIYFENGFVNKKAFEFYQAKLREIEEENEKRNVFKKIFHIDNKKPKLAVIDKLHELAEKDDKNRSNIEVHLAELTGEMEKSFDKLMVKPCLEILGSGDIKLVISEDKSGRIPAEIVHRVINKIQHEKGKDNVPLVGARFSAKKDYLESTEWLLKEISYKNIGNGGILYVTEYVNTGSTIGKVFHAFSLAMRELKSKNAEIPEFSLFLNMGDREMGYYASSTKDSETFGHKTGLIDGGGRDINWLYREFSGLVDQPSEFAPEEFDRMREDVIEKLSEKIIKKYKEQQSQQ